MLPEHLRHAKVGQVWKDSLHHCSWETIRVLNHFSLIVATKNNRRKIRKWVKVELSTLSIARVDISLEKHRYEESQESSEETRGEACWDKGYRNRLDSLFSGTFLTPTTRFLRFSLKTFWQNIFQCKSGRMRDRLSDSLKMLINVYNLAKVASLPCYSLCMRFIELLSSSLLRLQLPSVELDLWVVAGGVFPDCGLHWAYLIVVLLRCATTSIPMLRVSFVLWDS